ncbi:dynamin-2A-like protein [Carex littledalei]|uniref:Dynamin-2A-like protein n=1 Tax=Carex littledalei TaxID=544730 RepID=A0A833QYB8_9POAL|nr:dynamin-2A-like protein [Carex littledalei]
MEAIEELSQLADSMLQASALLADEDTDSPNPKRKSTFLNVVALGNVGAGKSAVLNSLIGHPVLLESHNSLSLSYVGALRHSLQDRLSKGSGGSGRGRADEIYLKLRTSTAPPLKLIDLPGLDQRVMDETSLAQYGANNDAILLVIIPASQAPEVSSSRALRLAKEFDSEGTRTVGVISKIDQVAGEQKSLAAVQALLAGQGPRSTVDIPFVALIGQSVSIASAQSGGSVGAENSLETAWRAESESLKSILSGAPPSKLGRVALVDMLGKQIRSRMKVRLPNVLSGYVCLLVNAVENKRNLLDTS